MKLETTNNLTGKRGMSRSVFEVQQGIRGVRVHCSWTIRCGVRGLEHTVGLLYIVRPVGLKTLEKRAKERDACARS